MTEQRLQGSHDGHVPANNYLGDAFSNSFCVNLMTHLHALFNPHYLRALCAHWHRRVCLLKSQHYQYMGFHHTLPLPVTTKNIPHSA